LSYQELLEQVLSAASGLKSVGFVKGDRFAIWAPNCAEWIIAALAGQGLGGVLVPLNTRYKGGEAADILRRSHCKFLFTVDGFLGHDYPSMLKDEDLSDLRETIVLRGPGNPFTEFLATSKNDVTTDDFANVSPDDLSDIIFTSGTTGAPKGAMTSHGQNIEVFKSFTDAIGMNADDRYLIVNPFFHSFGYKAGWLSCLIKGAAIYPLAVFNPTDVMRQIARDKITVMPGAPTIFQTLLSAPDRADFDISSLRVATTGAATIPIDLIRAMHEDLGIDDVYSAYGLTESCGVVSLCRKGDDFETIATTCGRPLPGTSLKLVDESGHDVSAGEEGEIWVRGFHVMQGYLDNPEATSDTITEDGWLKTGDIGIQDENGYIKITDRKKDMVIVGGFNCYPAEIEKTLLQHNSIADVAAIGAPDERLGEVVHAYIVSSNGELDDGDLIAWAREHMANYKVPRRFIQMDALPRNASGKVQKFLLKP
jgi:acyl-CoA synthetase (AMP-forming)/AMP-acid ligase II